MKTRDLHAIWDAPDHSRLTTKQFTVRLPVRVAAQIAALSDMYPKKTKTELIGDLLAAALDELAQELPTTKVGDRPVHVDKDGEETWNQKGPGVTFFNLFNKYLQEFETEEGHETPTALTDRPKQVRGTKSRKSSGQQSKR
jgi:hypothetical protein